MLLNSPLFSSIASFANKYLFQWLSGSSASEIVGSTFGVSLLLGGAVLLIKQAITGDEGFKAIKQLALYSLIPVSLAGIGLAINFSNIQLALTNFFIVVRRLLIVWNFWIDVPLLLGIMLTVFTILGAYWTYKSYMFFIRFFNER